MAVCKRDARRADGVAVLNQLDHVVSTSDLSLLQSDDLHLLFTVLQHSQLLFVVQQVEHLHQQQQPTWVAAWYSG